MTRPRVRGGPTDRDRRQTELDVIVDDVRLASWNDGCVRRGATPRLQSCGNLDDWTVIDRTTLRGLTQFPRGSVSDVPQNVEFKSHRATVRFKGGFCATLFQAARKPLILKRRDVGVVDRARLENDVGDQRQATPTHRIAQSLSELTAQPDHAVCVAKPQYGSRF
jgi:hypothetical protein